MCGIAGIVNFDGSNPPRQDELERMAASLAHRGPDEAGVYLDNDNHLCGLAHRRLSVIDPAGGHQPLCNEEKKLWICYNGECYNFPVLKKELEACGYRFRSNCDTEVVLNLYHRYGANCVDHIRGMFAMAIWDGNRRELFLARDRMGQKPLYYAVHNGRFIFASECKAILQTKDFPRRPDREAIGLYLMLQYVPYPKSGFADISQLPPAHTLTISSKNINNPRPRRYWSIPTEPSFNGGIGDAVEQLRYELTHATKIRMISDVPLGAFLSGGIDSTIIAGLMSRAQENPVKTCSIGFTESLYNELPYARIAAERFGCDHYEQIVRADCVETIEKLAYYYDEPFADCSALPSFHLSRLARSEVTVALSGDGGDECFGGYDRYKAIKLSERINNSMLLRRLAGSRLWDILPASEHRSGLHRLKRFLGGSVLPAHKRYLKWLSVFDPEMLADLLPESESITWQWDHLKDYFTPRASSNKQSQQSVPENTSTRLMAGAMLADGYTYLPGDINTKVDRASMSTGLEVRCPFQDHKVVELAYSLPTAFRHNGKIGKYILRMAFSDLLPAKIKGQSKKGFAVPVGRWFRGELRGMFIDTVLSSRALERGYFNRKAIERLLNENDKKQNDHGHRMWSLLMLELWQRRYIDRNSRE